MSKHTLYKSHLQVTIANKKKEIIHLKRELMDLQAELKHVNKSHITEKQKESFKKARAKLEQKRQLKSKK